MKEWLPVAITLSELRKCLVKHFGFFQTLKLLSSFQAKLEEPWEESPLKLLDYASDDGEEDDDDDNSSWWGHPACVSFLWCRVPTLSDSPPGDSNTYLWSISPSSTLSQIILTTLCQTLTETKTLTKLVFGVVKFETKRQHSAALSTKFMRVLFTVSASHGRKFWRGQSNALQIFTAHSDFLTLRLYTLIVWVYLVILQ